MIRRLLSLVFVVTCLSCAPQRKTVVVYSPHGKEMLSAFEKMYESAHPDIDVQWLDMGSQDAYDRIRTERRNPQADVWWGAPSSIFMKAEAESLLARYVPTWDGVVPASSKSTGGYWYGTFITPEVIMYNNRVIMPADAPRDWDDLLDPKWKGKIVIRYPLASGTMRIIFSALIQRQVEKTGNKEAGFHWLQQLDANTRAYTADPTQLYLKIAREEGLISLWNLPDVIMQTETNGYPFGYVIPQSGTPLITDCIAIVRNAKHLDDAVSFYEFVTSRDALLKQAKEFYRIPARRDFQREELPSWLTSIDIRPMEVNWQMLESQEKEWMKYWDEQIKGTGNRRTSD